MRTDWTPASVSAVRPGYELGSGVGTLDLSGVLIPADSSVATRVEVGAGLLKVVVPKDATVELRTELGAGDIRLPGQTRQGLRIRTDHNRQQTLEPPQGSDPAGTLDLRLEVGVGQVEVTRAAK